MNGVQPNTQQGLHPAQSRCGASIVAMLAEHEENRTAQIEAMEPIPDETPQDDKGPYLWTQFKSSAEDVRQMIRLTIPRFLLLAELVIEKAGPPHGFRPYFDITDSLFALLVCYRTGWGPSLLAAMFHMSHKRDAIQSAIVRVRSLLHEVLQSIQMQFLHVRPAVQSQHEFMVPEEFEALSFNLTHIGITVDATPCLIEKPGISFEAAKAWWDQHHSCYSMKLEVGVSTASPHYAVAWSKLEPGSTADISLHRQTVAKYSEYMAFTQSELSTFATTIPVVDRPTAWTSIADSAYNGHVDSTFPRIALPKLPVLSTSRVPVDVRYLRRVRVVVEQYFGRMKRSWELMSRPFPLGAKYHQQDVDNIIVLTNILLRDSRIPLNDDDQQFYLEKVATHQKERR